MNFNLYFCLTIACKAAMANNWTLKNEGQCFYTVISSNLSEIMINKIPMCDYVKPYITFVINNSNRTNVSSNFIHTNFNPWIRIFKATNNTWTNLLSNAFSNLKNLLYIDLSGNNIKNVNPAFRGLKSLDFLNLSRNLIENLTPNVFLTSSPQETKLHLLDLSYNALEHLPENLFQHLHSLRLLYLQGNKISVLADVLFRPLKNLVHLNLSGNNLTNLSPMKYLPLLAELDLSSNRISFIENNTFSSLKSLQSVDLSHNLIKNTKVYRYKNMNSDTDNNDVIYDNNDLSKFTLE